MCASDSEAQLLGSHVSISNGFVSFKLYDTCDDFDFKIVNFTFLDAHIPLSTSFFVYISQFNWFPRLSSHVTDCNARNKILTANLFQQGYSNHQFGNLLF